MTSSADSSFSEDAVLETVDGIFSDEQHQELDRRVNALRRPVFDAIKLLCLVCKNSDGKLRNDLEDYDPAAVFCEKYEKVHEVLKQAHKGKEYKTIRILKILKQRRKPEPKSPISKVPMAGLQEAWDAPFAGSGHKLLEQTVHKMNMKRGNRRYGNYLPIVQSSGTGKSRLVDELARSVFTIPFNLRPANMSGYPEPNNSARRLFLRPSPDFYKIRNEYCKFFAELFNLVGEKVKSWMELPGHQFDSWEALAEWWREELKKKATDAADQSKRDELYRILELKMVGRKTMLDTEQVNSQLEAAAAALVEKLNQHVKERQLHKKTKASLSYSFAPVESRVRLMMYFDEAHSLTDANVETDGLRRNYYDALCSALDKIRNASVFAITMSTNLNLSKLSPAGVVHPSDRAMNSDAYQTPFTELPFDILFDGKPIVNGQSLREISAVNFMAKFGRPLFATLTAKNTDQEMIEFARIKLTSQALGERLSDEAQLAVLSTRLLLEFDGTQEAARQAEAKLVKGNMRIAYTVPSHRTYMYSGYSSEPILAEAAAQEMSRLRNVPSVLGKFVKSGMINKGSRGELVARLLLTEAYDAAVKLAHARGGAHGEDEDMDGGEGKEGDGDAEGEKDGDGNTDENVGMDEDMDGDRIRDDDEDEDEGEDEDEDEDEDGEDNEDMAMDVDERKDEHEHESANAQSSNLKGVPIPPLFHSNPVRLFTFLEALLGTSNYEQVLKLEPENSPARKEQSQKSDKDSDANELPKDETFEEAFKGAFVRFTHFSAFGSDGQTTTSAAYAAISRATAIQCYHSQKSIDIIIPVAMDIDKPLSEKSMTGILIQVKNRDTASPVRVRESDVRFFPRVKGEGKGKGRPYITLVMELSSLRGISHVVDTTGRHPRYRITVQGYSSEMYAVVKNEETYALLLRDHDIVDEHSRQEDEYLQVVRRLKARFDRGPDYYDWYKSAGLNKRPETKGWKRGLIQQAFIV